MSTVKVNEFNRLMAAFVTLAGLLALVGAVIGSFVNLVVYRLPRNAPIALARSKSDCCGETLTALELAPVVSWLIQRGRCKRCGQPVSARHPLVELGGAAIGAWAAIASGSPMEAALAAAFGWQLLLTGLLDADALWLPDGLTLPLLGSGLVATALLPSRGLWDAVIGAVIGFLILALVRTTYQAFRKREGLGGGDPILFAAVGAWVGWMGLPSVLLWACAAGLSWVGARAISRRPILSDQPLAFGPFIAIGAWLTWLYGPVGLG